MRKEGLVVRLMLRPVLGQEFANLISLRDRRECLWREISGQHVDCRERGESTLMAESRA